MDITIKRIEPEDAPMHLLLDADPSTREVQEYLRRGSCHVAMLRDMLVGVFVLLETRPFTMELMNLAVEESLHGNGIAKRMIAESAKIAQQSGCEILEVGTGDAGIGQLALYQKCGFQIASIDQDFFTRHYPEEIVENGIRCRHMVRLRMYLN